nr:hypothetical protein [uncultured Dyadobacter sp.]
MRNKLLILTILHYTWLVGIGYASPKIDPIKFTMSTNASAVALNEEFQIDIRASYVHIPSNTAFVFEGSNAFRLKLVLPDGFEQTGGNFSDYIGGELSSTKPYVAFTLKGKFTRESPSGVFQLLRSHKNADNQSTYLQVATISFKAEEPGQQADESNARIALQQTPAYISYMTISQLRSGLADTSRAVFVIDNLRYGLFRYNPSSTSSDDGAMTIVSAGRRYERVYEGAINVNWFGIVGDGVTDQAPAIQAMLNNARYRNVFFPKSAQSYRIRSIRIPSNTTMEFEEGTVVEGTGGLGATEKLMYMYDVGNIIIRGYGVVFKDHRENYTSGQHRHIFSLEGVVNAVIEGMAANDSGGDGFYVGAGTYQKFGDNIKFLNVSANNNRRHGMAVTTARNIDIVNAVLTNTVGEGPQAGLNFEANNAENRFEGVRVENPRTGGNNGPGIMISPGALAASDKVIDITVSNHLDDGSLYGFLVTTVRSSLPGSVNVENATWKNSKYCGFVSRNWSYRACAVVVTNPTVINCNALGSTSPTAGAAFYVHREAADTGDSNIGNIHIINPRIMDMRNPQLTVRAFSFRDWAIANPILSCSIIDPIKVSTFFPSNNMIVNAQIVLSDRNGAMVHDFNAWNSMADYTYYRPLYHNQTAPGGRNLALGKVNAGFPEVTVEVRAPYNINIIPNPTDNIMPLSPVNGKSISSNVVGSKVKLKKASDNTWFITEMVGTWNVQP